MRFERRGRGVAASFVVRPLRVPGARGPALQAALPVEAERHVRRLAARLEGFDLLEEGKARVNGAPGYQVAYRSGPPARPTLWRDVLVVPDEPAPVAGALLRLEQRFAGRRPARARRATLPVRKAFRSFRFGRERG
jgi:hypothetical protein